MPVSPIAPFSSPFATNRPVEANEVRGNDNVLREGVNAVVSAITDGTVLNVSALADRPAFGISGRVWLTLAGASEFQVWLDDGTQWRSLLP